MTLSIANAQAINVCDEVVDSVDLGTTDPNGEVVIYSGTPPANVDASLAGNTVLAELAMSNPAFGNATDATPGATATANSISDDTSANATGTASFFRILDRDNTPRIQGTITATGGGGDMELNSTSISSGATVSISSMTITMPEA